MIRTFVAAKRVVPVCLLAMSGAACAGTISTQQEVQLGREYAVEVERQLPMVQDAAINQYIQSLGSQIASRADPRGLQYRFRVVNANEVNAFALPGGYVYVNRGLIERSSSMSDLAGVLAHEIAHVVERHSIERMEKAQGANALASVVYGVLLGRNPSTAEQIGIQVGGSAVFAHYSRDAEREADMEGIPYLVRAGIDPRGMESMFRILLEERERSPGTVERWFSTHPLTEERLQEVRARIAQLPAGTLNGLTRNTREFDQFRTRLRNLPPAPRQ